MNKNEVKIVYVEGNVGCGKTTFLELIKERLNIQILEEPVDLWQNIDGNNLLENFFLNQERWAFDLQMYITVTRIDQLKNYAKNNLDRFQFVERSVFSGRYCFAKNLFDTGKMSDLEWALYQKLWDRDVDIISSFPLGFIYLRTPAQICLKRISLRNRKEESPITLNYLQLLEKKHEDWFFHKKVVNPHLLNIPILVLDGSKDMLHDVNLREEYFDKVDSFIKML